MRYEPVGHITGIHVTSLDLTVRIPWLYMIAAVGSSVLYVGETYADGGLISRLSSHFGPYPVSTLKQRAETVASIRMLRPPFIVVAARLPMGEDDTPFDASAKQVRLMCEALLHEVAARQFVPQNPQWTIVSTPQGSKISSTAEMEEMCHSIFDCFNSAYGFLASLGPATPFQLCLLEKHKAQPIPTSVDLGMLMEEVEMIVFQSMIGILKKELGDRWWVDGIPETTRIQCQTRREQESVGEEIPPEAYLTLIDFREIARKNWLLFQKTFEAVSGQQGKDKGTQWLQELNESRKLWAHPVKRLFSPLDPARIITVRSLSVKVKESFSIVNP